MSTKQELTDLTVCRAVFAGWVFIYHVDLYVNFSRFLGPAADLIRRGYLGVDGFFMLSGLILARVHMDLAGNAKVAWTQGLVPFQPPSFGMMLRFWGKRLARIYPVHLATIIILAILLGLGMSRGWIPHDPSRFSVSSLVQNLLLVQGWGGSPRGNWNYPSWSISTEWAGYLAFPILWYVLAYLPAVVSMQVLIASLALLGLVFVMNGYDLNLAFADGLYRFVPEFIAGMASARIVHIFADLAPVRRVAFLAGVIIALLSACIGFDFLVVIGLWLVLFAFLMQADTGLPAMLGWRPVLDWLGKRSYAFYMSFAIAELLMCQDFEHSGWTPKGHGLIFAGGMLGITMFLAVMLFTFVESPCRHWLDQRLTVPDANLKGST